MRPPTWRAPSGCSISWPALMRGGYKLGKGDVKTAAQLVAQDESVELADYFLRGAPRTSGKRQVLPKSVNQRRYLDAIDKHDIVFGIGPAGTGKTYLAMAQAVVVPARQAGQPDHPGAAGGGGGREARLPARRSAGEGQPVSAAALRRALRHDRDRARRAAARARHDRGRADRVHARPHAERRVRHPRRGAEHDLRADEDVPDAPRLRLEGGHHRGHHADRSADGRTSGPGRSDEGRRQHRGHRVHPFRRARTSCAISSCSRSSRRTKRTVDPDSSRARASR